MYMQTDHLVQIWISTSLNSQAPRAQKDMRDHRRYGLRTFVLTMATIVNGPYATDAVDAFGALHRSLTRCAHSTLNPR